MTKTRTVSRRKPRDRGRVRKCMRIDQEKLDTAKKHFGAATETAAVDRALDYVIFQAEVLSGLEALAASGPLRDPYAERKPLRRSWETATSRT